MIVSKCTTTRLGLLLLLLLISAPTATFAMSEHAAPCSLRLLEDYQACLAAHPCECQHCDPDPTDHDPILRIDHPEDCSDVRAAMCPLVNCCRDVCLTTNLAFYHCASQVMSIFFTGNTCPVDGNSCLGIPAHEPAPRCENNGSDGDATTGIEGFIQESEVSKSVFESSSIAIQPILLTGVTSMGMMLLAIQ